MTINIDVDWSLYAKMVNELQEIVAHLTFAIPGIHLDWNSPEIMWEPESADEEEKTAVAGIRLVYEYPQDPILLKPEHLAELINEKANLRRLVIPKQFFGEAVHAFESRRYIDAFRNHFLALENIYGQGKTKNRDIAASFVGNPDYGKGAERVLKATRADARHSNNLDELGQKYRINISTIEKLTDLFLRIRGSIQHSSGTAQTGLYASPLDHLKYETPAWMLMSITAEAIGTLEARSLR